MHCGSWPFPSLRRERGTHSEGYGRSRGAYTSKIHARCNNQGRPLGFILTEGLVSDYKATDTLLMLPVPNPRAMLAERGYDSDCFRQALLIHAILPVVPSREGRKAPQQTDWRRYRDRDRIERMFNRLKQMRRIATRYDKTAFSFVSFLNLGAARH
nr:IS5 family transposase [Asaia bogorensis]